MHRVQEGQPSRRSTSQVGHNGDVSTSPSQLSDPQSARRALGRQVRGADAFANSPKSSTEQEGRTASSLFSSTSIDYKVTGEKRAHSHVSPPKSSGLVLLRKCAIDHSVCVNDRGPQTSGSVGRIAVSELGHRRRSRRLFETVGRNRNTQGLEHGRRPASLHYGRRAIALQAKGDELAHYRLSSIAAQEET